MPSKANIEKRKRSPTPPTSSDDVKKILHFLLNDAASQFGAGKGAAQPNLFDILTESSEYTPFQNLIMSVVMSKPISSRLGSRTLLTLFSDDVDFTNPAKIRDAGDDGRYDALSKARTQHKDKTSTQLGRLADKVIEEYADNEKDTSLQKMRDAANGSAEEIGRIVKDFYGFGQTAVDVFSRRMQGEWSELYPCADERALNAAAHLGLEHDSAQSLAKQIDNVLGDKDENARHKQFAQIVDALVAVDLEHRYEDLLNSIDKTEAPPAEEAKKPPKKAAKKSK